MPHAVAPAQNSLEPYWDLVPGVSNGDTRPGADASGTVPHMALELPRYVWASTTVRQPGNAESIRRLERIINAAPGLTVDKYATPAAYKAQLGVELSTDGEAPLNEDVVGKLLNLAERLGCISRASSPVDRDSWIVVHPAGLDFATTPDPAGKLAWLLLHTPLSPDTPHPYAVELLRFIQECHDSGLEDVRTDWVARFMATHATPGSWTQRVKSLRSHLNAVAPSEAVDALQWRHVIDGYPEFRGQVRDAVTGLMDAGCLTRADVLAQVRARSSQLLPNSRPSRQEEFADAVAGHVLAGDAAAVRDAAEENVIAKKLDTHYDYVLSALRMLASTDLLEEIPVQGVAGKAGRRFKLTGFGREALTHAPNPSTYETLKRVQRSLIGHPFANRNQVRADRVDAKILEWRTPVGRSRLITALSWELYAGRRQAHCYEWAAVSSIVSLVTTAPIPDYAAAFRTRLGFDLEPTGHAPGGDADAILPLATGLTLLVEVTGVVGGAQISKELESIARHLRTWLETHPGERAVTVFVCPELDTDFVSHLLTYAAGDPDDGIPEALIVPMSEGQVQHLLAAEESIDALLEACASAVSAAAAAAGPPRQRARGLLVTLDDIIHAR